MSEQIMANQTKNGEDLFINNDDVPQIIVITVILSAFSVMGTTGNAFVLYVFSRKKDKNTSTIFILALAVIDFLTCLFVIPFTIYVEFRHKKINSDMLCKLYQFLITSNVPFSAFIMVAIAFDRYFCICRPWIKCIDVKRAKRIIFSLFIFATSLGLITCLAYGVYQQPGTSNTTDMTDRSRVIINCSVILNNDTSTFHINDHNVSLAAPMACTDSFDLTSRNSSTKIAEARFEYTGFCYPNEVILSLRIRKIYHAFYVSLFFISFITVFILYGFIYKSLLTRRAKRLRTSALYRNKGGRRSTLFSSMFTRQSFCPEKSSAETESLNNQPTEPAEDKAEQHKSTTIKFTDNLAVPIQTEQSRSLTSLTVNSVEATSMIESTEHIANEIIEQHSSNANDITSTRPKSYTRKNKIARSKETNMERQYASNENNSDTKKTIAISIYRKDTRKSVREKHLLANVKTAGILFIVTLVFILAFLPSWLMAIKVIPVNMIVFYMYFSYNVANPVIYAFFNNTFQKEVRHMLKCSV